MPADGIVSSVTYTWEILQSLPFTPFHYPLAYLFYRFNQSLSLPGLIVGAFFPDVEVPLIVLLYDGNTPNRLVLHSLLGAATIGTLLSATLTVLFYPAIVTRIFRLDPVKARERSRFSPGLLLACLLGNLSHVLLDLPNHPYNPIYWPFSPYFVGSPVAPFVGGIDNAMSITIAAMILLFLGLFWRRRDNFWERALLGD